MVSRWLRTALAAVLLPVALGATVARADTPGGWFADHETTGPPWAPGFGDWTWFNQPTLDPGEMQIATTTDRNGAPTHALELHVTPAEIATGDWGKTEAKVYKEWALGAPETGWTGDNGQAESA